MKIINGLISSLSIDNNEVDNAYLYIIQYVQRKLIPKVIVHDQAIASNERKQNAAIRNPATVVEVFLIPAQNIILVLYDAMKILPLVDKIICKGIERANTLKIGTAASHLLPQKI